VDERFLRAWFCKSHRVLGRKLKPFSLAHRLVLEAIDSPFCYEDRPFSFADLAIAIRICASSDPFAPIDPPTWMDRFRFWRAAFDPAYFRQCSQQFVDYLEDHSSSPKFWNRVDDELHREAIPWLLHVAASILRQTSLSEAEVWAMPLGRALWYATALAKQDGCDLDVLTTQDEELLDSIHKEVQS
jgi:hypothetical protein